MASGLYNRAKFNLMKKLMDMSADTFKVILLNVSHSFNAAHNVYSDISTNELPTAGGYIVTGSAIASPTVVQLDSPDNCAMFDGNDVSWTSATFTAYYAAIYDATVSNNLVACIDFGGAKVVSSGTFTIQWSASGILRLS